MVKILERLKDLPLWQRYALLLAIPVAVIIYTWMMLISPAFGEKSKLEADIKNIKADIQRIRAGLDPRILEALRKQEEELNEEYSKKYGELISLVGEIPTERDMGLVLRNIGRIANRSGVLILEMKVSAPEKVEYYLAQHGEKKLVKEVQKPKDGQQAQQPAQQPPQQPQPKPESIAFLRSELKLSLLGDYRAIRAFLEGLKKEGVISYPSTLTLITQENGVKADLDIFLIIKEEKEL